MKTVSDQLDYDARLSERVKFKQQMALGVGGAMVFGLVGAIGHSLIGLMSATTTTTILGAAVATSTLAIGGLALLGVVGVGSIFMGSKYLAESIRIDQNRQAQQIGKATGFAVAQPVSAPTKTITSTPPGMGVQGAHADKADHHHHSSLQQASPKITETASIERLHAPHRELHA